MAHIWILENDDCDRERMIQELQDRLPNAYIKGFDSYYELLNTPGSPDYLVLDMGPVTCMSPLGNSMSGWNWIVDRFKKAIFCVYSMGYDPCVEDAADTDEVVVFPMRNHWPEAFLEIYEEYK